MKITVTLYRLLDYGDRIAITMPVTQEPTIGKSTTKNAHRGASKARR
jgi:hypothetical protein